MDHNETYIQLDVEDAEVILDLLKSLSCIYEYEPSGYHCCDAGELVHILEEKIGIEE